jgi:caspase domain-containing protein
VKPAVKPNIVALPVAAALSILLSAAFSSSSTVATSSPQEQSDTRGVTPEQRTKAQVASELNGHYYALLIGINNYQHLQKLSTARQDAQSLASLLHDQYGFQTTLLLDAKRDQIMKALNDYRRNLDENASLLIYYAGHGNFDRVADKAYWLPADADPNDTSEWILADDITTDVKVIPARHVLIISDSCYSGGLARDMSPSFTPQEHQRFLEKMALAKSRTLMSSGGLEPVLDEGGGGHSIFSGALIKALSSYSDDVFSAGALFEQYIQVSVAGRSAQTPQYDPIRNSGHDFGDFVFVRSGNAPAPETSAAPPAPTPQPASRQPAYKPPAPAPAKISATKASASPTYGGIRFEVKRIDSSDLKAPRVLIVATNMQQQNLKIKIYAPPDPKVIDSNAIVSSGYAVDGVELCRNGGNFANCATPDPNHWSVAYPGVPLNIALTFRGPQDFRGSSANVSFDVLLGTEKDDGSIKSTLVPVVLSNLPLRPDAPVRSALASRAYAGVSFDVMSIQTEGKALRVLVAATNTQKGDLKFKIYAPPDPKVIDSNAIASGGYAVDGVELCRNGGNFANCATPDPNHWSVAYPGIPLDFALTFQGPQDFRGSSANVSFDVLLGIEKDDGSIKPTLVPVVLPNVPLRPDAPVRPALSSRTYAGVSFDVMSIQADGKALRVLVAATNTQQTDLKFKIYAPPDPKVIDSNGVASGGYAVDGVELCRNGGNFANCATPDPNHWSVAYSGIPLNIALTFQGPQDFRGSSGNVSFDVLLGTEKDDGSIKATLVPVTLSNVPLTH